ncbi:MAG: exo-alpha-sialidase [Anaerolineales bacterium]|nr:exo-alpha-sialidase [Anaerolineales bacterium]
MSKLLKFLIFLLVLLLVACNRPKGEPKTLPPDTSNTPREVSTEISETEESYSPSITDTPQPAVTADNLPPVEPTVNMTQVLQGNLIPIFPPGTEINIHEIHMDNNLAGWAIAVSDSEIEHILTTEDGGNTWQDVTPPQPLITGNGGYSTADMGVWDANNAWVNYAGSDLIWSTKNSGITWDVIPVQYITLHEAMVSVLDENHIWVFQFLDAGMHKVYTALVRSISGGDSWDLLLDPYTDSSIQSFYKNEAVFINPQYGWLTKDFDGVTPFVHLSLTQDGGITWEELELPAPPSLPDVFLEGACGLYDPYLVSSLQGSFRLSCLYNLNDQRMEQDFLYKTSDGGSTWLILDAPGGEIYQINDMVMYALGRDIYRSDDGGENWRYIKAVFWDGQFDFINQNTAWAVASDKSDWENPEYALVKTTDGCNSFSIIVPEIIASTTNR